MTAERLLSVHEVAEWLQISPSWVRDHSGPNPRRRPHITCVMLGELRRFRKSDVEAFIAQMLKEAGV